MDSIRIGDRLVGGGEPTFVIAEAGSNHNGDLDTAKELIDVAAEAGADAVKFQTFRAENLYVKDSGTVEYLEDNRPINEIIEEMEMPYEWIPELHSHALERDVIFLSTPFDERSAEVLEEHVPAYKVASYTLSHHPFLEFLAEKGKPIILSTGAHDRNEVDEVTELLGDLGFGQLVLLQCIASYPAPLDSINVRVVETYRDEYGVPAGLSDHTLDPMAAPCAAVALGASVLEKHLTLDNEMEGPDHTFALEPDEFTTMVDAVRKTETALGDGMKSIHPAEDELRDVGRRRIYASTDIKRGQTLTEDAIKIVRSGRREKGVEPKHLDEVLGRTAREDIRSDDPIVWELLDDR